MASQARPLRRICVFSGSSAGNDEHYKVVAAALGLELAKRGITLVYGGGSLGLMGACSQTSQQNGGKVISVIPGPLAPKDLSGNSQGYVFTTPDMHQRKAIMYRLSDAFIALPGGLGTFEEAVEATHWTNSGIHRKPLGFLNINNYYDGILEQLDNIVKSGFAEADLHDLYCSHGDAAQLIDQLAQMTLADSQHPQSWTLAEVARLAEAEVAAADPDL